LKNVFALPLALALLAASANAWSQPTRPKICLALSGGGARGIAHVGVLRVLEEARIPIDCIAGTSMGAIVGGLYASGLNSAEIETRLASLDWAAIRENREARQKLDPRRREDDYDMNIPIEIRVREGQLRLPQGIIAGRLFDNKLKDWVAPVERVTDFDKLPIPFRAIGTRLGTGERHVFKGGALDEVMRASMSVPGLFSPMRIDGAVYVDGGLVENLPLRAAREMGADIVIAVNVGTPLTPENQIQNFVDVTMQMLQILTERNVTEQLAALKSTDILISPKLDDFGFMDFLKTGPLLERGDTAARAQLATLEKLALAPAAYAAQTKLRRERMAAAIIPHQLLETKPATEPAQDYTPPAFPLVLTRPDEHRVRTGISLGTDFNTGYFRLNVGHEAIFGSGGARWRNAIEIGRLQKYTSEWLHTNDGELGWFYAPRFELQRRQFPLYVDNKRVADTIVHRGQLAFDLGHLDRQFGEVRLGVTVDRTISKLAAGGIYDPATDHVIPTASISANTMGLRLAATHDSLDNALLARQGRRLSVLAERGLAVDDRHRSFAFASIDATQMVPIGQHVLELHASGGGYAKGSAITPQLFSLGGFLRLSGFDQDRFVGRSATLGRLVWRHHLGSTGALGYNQYLGASVEIGRVNRQIGLLHEPASRTQQAGSVFWALETPVGPFYLAAGFPKSELPRLYMFLGRP
jgi:NTE family protein